MTDSSAAQRQPLDSAASSDASLAASRSGTDGDDRDGIGNSYSNSAIANGPNAGATSDATAVPLLTVQGARLALGGREILRDIDLTLAPGEVVALLGASGCGKTTLLRSIAGLQALDAGRIGIAGRDVSALPAQQRDIGMMFQHYALFPNLSVRENITFGLLARGQAQAVADARADALLDLIDLRALATRLPSALSGGQRQRVALARALANEPRLLLMDEPFSALDEHFRLPLRRQFRQLQRALGQSCLIVTHDREEAFELADRVAVMFDGQIAQCASPRELWRAPASCRVADFLGVFNRLEAASLTGAWHRPDGHWLAPIDTLRVLPAHAAETEDALCLSATLQAAYWGQQRVAWELRTESGARLNVWSGHDAVVPEVGAIVRVSIPASALRWLAQ